MQKCTSCLENLFSNVPLIYNVNFNDFQLVVDGFIDNLLLSKCSIIIGTWGSTFSEIAWWFGKCKSKVVIPKPLNLDQNFVDLVFIKGEN